MAERPVLKRPPPRVTASVRALLAERGEVARPELLEWARSQGLVKRNDAGALVLRVRLCEMAARGEIEVNRQVVRKCENPAPSKNLSRRKRFRNDFPESLRKALIGHIFQAVSNWKARNETNNFHHEGLAR